MYLARRAVDELGEIEDEIGILDEDELRRLETAEELDTSTGLETAEELDTSTRLDTSTGLDTS
jgi:hypothetical protein